MPGQSLLSVDALSAQISENETDTLSVTVLQIRNKIRSDTEDLVSGVHTELKLVFEPELELWLNGNNTVPM